MPRGKNARPVTYPPAAGADRRWHSFVPIGTKVDGKLDRSHRTGTMCNKCKIVPDKACACYRKVEDKIRQLEDELAKGAVVKKPTNHATTSVEKLSAMWMKDCEVRGLRHGTLTSYRTVTTQYIHPKREPTQRLAGVGGLRVHQFNDEKPIKAFLADVKKVVSAQAARKTLRVLRAMLSYAEAEKIVSRNAAKFVAMPALDKTEEIIPLSLAEVRQVMPVIMKRRNSARWLLALVHGPRQGECLGLAYHRPAEPRMPSDVDTEAGTVRTRKKIERRSWQHGCEDPHACGGAPRPKRPHGHHKLKPCRQPCNRHTRACPPPCAKDCTGHASACPKRRGGGLVEGDPKSKASNHTHVLDSAVLQAFIDHEAQREADKKAAGSKWSWQHGCKAPATCADEPVSCPKRLDSGYVFTDVWGRAIDPKRDWDEWQSILLEAGLPPARVHDLRHTAATNLVAAGVDRRLRKELMGWAQDMPVYEHVATEMARDAVTKLGAYLWRPDQAGSDQPEPEPTGTDSATNLLPEPKSNVLPFRRKAV
jgi:integrase